MAAFGWRRPGKGEGNAGREPALARLAPRKHESRRAGSLKMLQALESLKVWEFYSAGAVSKLSKMGWWQVGNVR